MQANANLRPVSLLVCALGGEGGGVLAEWLIDTAIASDYPAQSTSVPGVAQRTGATSYYIEVFPVSHAELGGRRPVFGLNPVTGAIDALVSSELLETARQVSNGYSTPERTLLITSSSRALTTAERMVPADGRYPSDKLLELVREFSREHYVFDMAEVARETGTVISAVLFGAIAASGVLPFTREACEATIRRGGRGVEASLKGFARAFEIVSTAREQGSLVQQLLQLDGEPVAVAPLPAAVAAAFPNAVHDILSLGYARLADYQNESYAKLYTDRLARVLDAERNADPAGAHHFAITREMARFLALWMAFDDVVRVAYLKSRQARHQRVYNEVHAKPEDIVHIYDHFKPGVPEFAGLLPEFLASPLLRWDRKRQRNGAEPWAMPLKIGSHTVTGTLMLRMMGGMRHLRGMGSRFRREQAMIGRWLDAVVEGTQADWRVGHEIAQCGRLIKGYGETNERGKENLLHVLDHLAVSAQFDTPEARAQAIAEARQAALADAAGKQLDAALQRHGAPTRPIKEIPVRFVRRPAAAQGKS
ncbi:MAG: indolepyruvate oxidoreductase subunit beta family protein [Pigmentiphaga sp.]